MELVSRLVLCTGARISELIHRHVLPVLEASADDAVGEREQVTLHESVDVEEARRHDGWDCRSWDGAGVTEEIADTRNHQHRAREP